MVQHKNVKVTIVRYRDKQPYIEYKPKDKAAAGHRKAETTYIEAVSGERFAVVVEILPTFNFKSSRQVQVTVATDERVESSWTIDAKDVNGSAGAECLEDRQIVWDSEERLIDGKWNSHGLTFAQLKIDDGVELTEEQVLHDLNALGRVTVTVARGKRVPCEPYVSPSVQKIEERPTSSRDLVAKHHVSHTARLVKLGECEPFLNTFMFDPSITDTREKGGDPIQFIFRARSKESLRLLNIKSKRPVPPPGPPSAPGICGTDTAAGTKSSHVHARCDDDDDEEPYPKKSKTDIVAGARAVKLVFKRPHTSPQPATEGNNEHKDPTAANAAAVAQVKQHPQSVAEGCNDHGHKAPPAVATTPAAAQVNPHPHSATEGNKDHEHNDPTEADATQAAKAKFHPQPPVARNELKHEPIVIKDEDEDENVHSTITPPASREYSSNVRSQPRVPTTPSRSNDQARRERQKELLNNRLEQLKIEQKLLEMED